jgi:hypothetical protein
VSEELRNLFVCPGQAQPVSAAVHRSRLSAGWSVCDTCDWRLHTEGLSERSAQEVLQIQQRRAIGIERTEFGVRAAWLNVLTPATAADLARIFSLCLVSRWQELRGGTANGDSATDPAWTAIPELLLGYDGRSFSPEVFAGVAAAIREQGVTVLDAGRCTAASLQESLRCQPRAAGAILVTGAGRPQGWSGLDAFDQSGDGAQVVWKEFGVTLETLAAEDSESPTESATRSSTRLCLSMPRDGRSLTGLRRLARRSGRHVIACGEQEYRDWLAGWHQTTVGRRLLVGTDDPLLRQRVQWLAETVGAAVSWCSAQEARKAASQPTLEVLEDDRRSVFRRVGGTVVSVDQLTAVLNTADGYRRTQLTAHADPITGRLWLTDAARPGSVGLTEHIEDALVLAGLLLSRKGRGDGLV